MTGAANSASSACMTVRGSGADDERTKRNPAFAAAPGLRGARASTAWCIVGTAVNHVAPPALSQEKKRSALKPGAQNTLPPAASDDSTAAINPWMWNSGMTLRQRSPGPSASAAAICRADAARLAWVSGTFFGREVVPDVCSASAASSGAAGRASARPDAGEPVSAKSPAAAPASSSNTGIPRRAAAPRAGLSASAARISARAPRSPR